MKTELYDFTLDTEAFGVINREDGSTVYTVEMYGLAKAEVDLMADDPKELLLAHLCEWIVFTQTHK